MEFNSTFSTQRHLIIFWMWHVKCPAPSKSAESMYLTSFEKKSDLQKEKSTFREFVSGYSDFLKNSFMQSVSHCTIKVDI